MPSKIYLSETITIGKQIALECSSPKARFAVVFEDDGNTGYFYSLNLSNEEQSILDAMYIYHVGNITDKDVPSKLEIVWSDDGLKACLVINRYPLAVFDFESNKAYCRSNFSPPDPKFTDSHEWNDKALELFK
jgi:hypothetical protein